MKTNFIALVAFFVGIILGIILISVYKPAPPKQCDDYTGYEYSVGGVPARCEAQLKILQDYAWRKRNE